MYSVMWSEHCSYKSSRRHLRPFPTEAPWVLVGPGRGRGRDRRRRRHRGRGPHREPQPPVGGRALPGRGHRRRRHHPRHLLDGRPPDRADGPAALRAARRRAHRYLFEGVVSGISGYGNAVGVPTVGGEVVFDDCYRENPLVNVLCLGVLPHERLVLAAPRAPATSRCCSARRPAATASVARACSRRRASRRARRRSVRRSRSATRSRRRSYRGVPRAARRRPRRRCAGPRRGRACRARRRRPRRRPGAGMDVDIARVSRREPGMNATEVMTSESQERMLAIVRPERSRRGARALRPLGDPRVGRRAGHRHRPVPGLRRPLRRRRRPRREPAAAAGRAAAHRCRRTRARRRRAGRQPRRRSAATTGRAARRPIWSSVEADDPAPELARRFPRGHRPVRRAARPARLADDRRQELGLAPVRPPAVPQHRRRPRRRRGGAPAQGHDPRRSRSPPTARRASAGSTRASARELAVLEAAPQPRLRRGASPRRW